MKIFISFLIAAVVAGCASPTPKIQRIPFPVAEYERLPSTGEQIVSGQAFLKTNSGDVKLAAGSEILLNPVTSYSDQFYNYHCKGKGALTEADPRYLKYIKTVIGDADGRFKFSNVAEGEYYLVTTITWMLPNGAWSGGLVCRKVTVSAEQENNFILTK